MVQRGKHQQWTGRGGFVQAVDVVVVRVGFRAGGASRRKSKSQGCLRETDRTGEPSQGPQASGRDCDLLAPSFTYCLQWSRPPPSHGSFHPWSSPSPSPTQKEVITKHRFDKVVVSFPVLTCNLDAYLPRYLLTVSMRPLCFALASRVPCPAISPLTDLQIYSIYSACHCTTKTPHSRHRTRTVTRAAMAPGQTKACVGLSLSCPESARRDRRRSLFTSNMAARPASSSPVRIVTALPRHQPLLLIMTTSLRYPFSLPIRPRIIPVCRA